MKLTLPKASVDPGRAARAPQITVNETAGAIGDLGKVMLDVGTKVVNQRLDGQFNRNQVDLTRDVNDLRLQIEEIGDPDQADAAWEAGVARLRDSYMSPGQDGSLRVHPRNAERFTLAMDGLVNRHAFSVGARNIALRQSQTMATYSDYVYEASRAAATSDAQTRDQMIAQGDLQIAGMLEDGVVTPEQAQKLRTDLRGEMTSSAALQALNDDPADYLERAETGEFQALDPDMAVRFRAAATDALVKQTELEQKQAEKAATEARKAASAELGRIASLNDTSRLSVEDRALIDNPEIRALAETDPDVALSLRKAEARISLDAEKPQFALMSPPELLSVIEAERARKVAHPFQEERLTVLEDLLGAKQKALSADPLGHVASIGFAPPPLPMDGDAAAFEQGLAQRKRHSQALQERGYIDRPVIFTPDERTALKAQLAPDADPATRQTLLSGIARQLGGDAAGVIEQATGDKVAAHVATLTQIGAPGDVLADVLTGQKRLTDGTATRPAAAAFRQTFAEQTGGVFHGQPELEARLMATAEVLYAEALPTADSTEIDSGTVASAISRAIGGDGAGLGGFAEIDPPGLRNEYSLPLPPGVSGRQVEDAMAAAVQELKPRVFHEEAGEFKIKDKPVPADFSRLQRASLTGAAPDLGDHKSQMFETLRITPWMPDGKLTDRYILTRQVNGQDVAVRDTKGGAYMFSLSKFVQGGTR